MIYAKCETFSNVFSQQILLQYLMIIINDNMKVKRTIFIKYYSVSFSRNQVTDIVKEQLCVCYVFFLSKKLVKTNINC